MVARRAYASCIFYQGSNQRSHLAGLHSYFQCPKTLQPTFLQILMSLINYHMDVNPSPLHFQLAAHLPVASTSLQRRRHHHHHQNAWAPIRTYTVLYLRIPLLRSHPPIPPLQHRYCRNPASYISFPPPLPGELGNPPGRRARAPPCAAPNMPILAPSQTPFWFHLWIPFPDCKRRTICSSVHPSPTTPPDAPFTCVRARDCLRVLAHHPILRLHLSLTAVGRSLHGTAHYVPRSEQATHCRESRSGTRHTCVVPRFHAAVSRPCLPPAPHG